VIGPHPTFGKNELSVKFLLHEGSGIILIGSYFGNIVKLIPVALFAVYLKLDTRNSAELGFKRFPLNFLV
jgi:hypothetical protein